jgi:diguanylate cyclase (GGDEF)-like protein
MFDPRARDALQCSSAPPISERPPRIIAISPSAERHRDVTELLEADGYEPLSLRDADEVLRVVAEYEPDLVLIDYEQSSGSGREVCGELKAADPQRHLPVMLLAWQPVDEAAVARGLLAGADDFVVDPSRRQELSARIRVLLRTKRSFDALHRIRNERDSLRRDAECDALTGLLNRRALERSAHDRVERRERFGVLFVDGDRFKSINDRFGHLVGDRVLVMIAEMLRAGLRPGDAVGRYGGEEFVALVAGAGPESARLVAERLRKSIEALEPPRPGPKQITISIGTAVYDPRTDDDAQAVFRRADVALYAAKRAGRNRVVMHTPECEAALFQASSCPPREPDPHGVADR